MAGVSKVELVESKQAMKALKQAPFEILKSYEIWARLVEEHGTRILRDFKGYGDEKLKGKWEGFRSSRLNRKWRVLYRSILEGRAEIVKVERVSAHNYRRS